LKLSNWEKIRDLAWNVHEHVNKANTLDWSDFNNGNTSLWSSSNSWQEWTHSNIDNDEKNNYWPLIWVDSDNWIWKIYDLDWVSSNIFVRGVTANEGVDTGIFWLKLNWNNSSYRTLGFRCAYIK